MTFPREVKNRVVQYPHRYKLVLVDGTTDTYDLVPVPGTVTEEGTAINKAYLQPIEDTIGAHLKDTANPHGVTKSQIGLGNVQNIKHNLNAGAKPTENDDSTDGYAIGSTWLYNVTRALYICLDATEGAALWGICAGTDWLFYYKAGDEYTDITGGWEAVTGNGFTGTATKNDDNLYCKSLSTANARAGFVTTNKVDLTDIKKVRVTWNGEMTSTGFVSLVVTGTKNDDTGGVAQWYLRETGTFAERTDALDVNGISGSYYIQLRCQTGAAGQTAEAYFRVVKGEK